MRMATQSIVVYGCCDETRLKEMEVWVSLNGPPNSGRLPRKFRFARNRKTIGWFRGSKALFFSLNQWIYLRSGVITDEPLRKPWRNSFRSTIKPGRILSDGLNSLWKSGWSFECYHFTFWYKILAKNFYVIDWIEIISHCNTSLKRESTEYRLKSYLYSEINIIKSEFKVMNRTKSSSHILDQNFLTTFWHHLIPSDHEISSLGRL